MTLEHLGYLIAGGYIDAEVYLDGLDDAERQQTLRKLAANGYAAICRKACCYQRPSNGRVICKRSSLSPAALDYATAALEAHNNGNWF